MNTALNTSDKARALPTILAHIADPAQQNVVARYLDGSLSPEMALMYWLKMTRNIETIHATLLAAGTSAGNSHDSQAMAAALSSLAALARKNHEGCDRIARMLRSEVDNDEPAPSVEDGIAFCKRLFDWSVEQSAEASVALYSLGNAAILDAATSEIVGVMREWNLVGRERSMLEIGCGIGRFEQALAADALSITGIDVSCNMVAAARVRCEGLANVSLLECSGRDLTQFTADSFDLVFAVDSFPYLFQSGMTLVEEHFREVARVLKPRGDFLILEFSYRNNLEADRSDVRRLAAAAGFNVLLDGAQPFAVWDGAAFHMRLRDAQ